MARVILPDGLPQLGQQVDVVDGPAHGKEIEFTGMQVVFAESVDHRQEFNEFAEPDPEKMGKRHLYKIREIEHKITGEKIWVYWYEGVVT